MSLEWIGIISSWVGLGIAFWQLQDVKNSQKQATLNRIAINANDVVVEAQRIETRANTLKRSYRSLFVFAGQPGSSREGLYLKAVDEKLAKVASHLEYAKPFVSNDGRLENISAKKMNTTDTKLAQTLAQVRAIREDLESECVSIENQCATYREKAIRGPNPR